MDPVPAVRVLLGEWRESDLRLRKRFFRDVAQPGATVCFCNLLVECLVDSEAKEVEVYVVGVDPDVEDVLIQDRLGSTPNVSAERCAWRAGPSEQQIASLDNMPVGHGSRIQVIWSFRSVQVLDTDDRQTVTRPLRGLESSTVDELRDRSDRRLDPARG